MKSKNEKRFPFLKATSIKGNHILKRLKKVGWVMLLVLTISLMSFSTLTKRNDSGRTGKEIFESNCARCHGTDGSKGKWGAKNLKVSSLTDNELLAIISNGKRIMPAWNESLSKNEIDLVKDYVKTLRNRN